jgi:hypothetical protein
LGKGAVTGHALKICVTGQAGEKRVKHQLLRLRALAEQSAHQTRQGQLALANKGGGLWASGQICKGGAVDELTQVGKERGQDVKRG